VSVAQFQQVSYGLTQALIPEPPLSIISRRNPTANDKAQIGTQWVNSATNSYFVLTSIVANVATWASAGTGAGVFFSLEATGGNITADLGNIIATAGDIVATAGDINAVAGSVNAGTDVNATNDVTAGNDVVADQNITATNGDITAAAGNIVATAGNIVATAGDITATAGSITAGTDLIADVDITSTTGNIVATLGNIEASAGHFIVNGVSILSGTGDPNTVVNAPQGSLYLNDAGSAINDRAWINIDGATAWTFITTGA